jgi:hypothetical protein
MTFLTRILRAADVAGPRHAEPGPAEPFRIEVDPVAGLIRVTRHPLASVIDLGQHFALLESEIAAIRRDGLPLRMIVDIREATVDSPAVAAQIGERVHGFDRPGDRIALIVRPGLLQLQVRRETPAHHRMFDTVAAAEAWLGLHG